MTSSIKRELALKIVNSISHQFSSTECERLASKIGTVPRKQNLPLFLIPVDEITKLSTQKISGEKLLECLKTNTSNKTEVTSRNEKHFISIDVEPKTLTQNVLRSLIKDGDNFSKVWLDNVNFWDVKKETVIIEYSSPNIAKPFHAGHLRSTVVGNFVANIHDRVGHSVHRINYLGDWGSQFGILSKGFQKFGNEELLRSNPLQHLYEIYVKSNKLAEVDESFKEETRSEFKNLENGDNASLDLWKRFREISQEELNRTYEEFGIHFDVYEGESHYAEKAKTACDELQDNGLCHLDQDGGLIYEFNHPSGLRKIVLRKSDGTNLYITRDVAAAIDRMERYNFGKMFYVVENGQNDHFLSLFDILKSMKKNWVDRLSHVKFGRVRGMSTRSGNAVLLKDILDEAESLAKEAMIKSPNTRVDIDNSNVARVLGASSLIVNDLRYRRLQDIAFSWETAVQVKGDSGIFLHYVYARLCSLKLNSGIDLNSDSDLSCLVEPHALDLIGQLSRYEDVIHSSYESLESSILLQYLFRLGHSINAALKVMRVKGESDQISNARLLLFSSAQLVLADGMKTILSATANMSKFVTFEHVLDYVGSAGRWQIYLFILTSISGFFGALHSLGSVFLAAIPDHWCSLPEFDDVDYFGFSWNETRIKGYSIPVDSNGRFERCFMYENNYSSIFNERWEDRILPNASTLAIEPCTSWKYDHSSFETTVVTQWDLVCSKAPLASTVQATYMVGVFFGTLLFGLLSDRFGRRFSVLIAVAEFSLGGLLAAIPIHYIWFITMRLLTGMGLGGVFSCCYVLMAEVVSPRLRDIAGIAFQIPFGLGYLVLPAIGYYIRTWIMLQLIISLLTLSLTAYFWILPESPRWLILHNRRDEAYHILRKTAKINNRPLFSSQELQVKLKYNQNLEIELNDNEETPSTWSILMDLFKTPQMRKRILVSYFAWTVVSLCYYGLSFASPNMGSNIHFITFLTAATEIPSYILGCFTVRYFPRRFNVCGTFFASGICCLLILLVPADNISILTGLAITGKFFINITYAIVYLYATEIFPTRNRNVALGTCSMWARVGAAIAPYIVDLLNGNTPLIIFGILAVIAGFLCILLPETKDKHLPQTVADVERQNSLPSDFVDL
ncbi:hypothetical protein CHUAL_007799 [Chamberlinius hualienensis]